MAFDRYSPLAASDEIVRRTMSPIAADRTSSYMQDKHQRLPEQSIDLAEERFSIYVPQGEVPGHGYGLVVFIPPYDEAKIPPDWRKVFDRHHLIYVAADRSGNEFNMIWRRLPLALHAYENVAARYRLDPARIIVSGWSGGSRTAMRVALSYPDVFRAAILNSGADPFGNAGIAVPPGDLFRLFQERSRLVMVSGTEDVLIGMRDDEMRVSAENLCVQGLLSQPMRRIGHALMSAQALENALDAIEADSPQGIGSHKVGLVECRTGIQSEIDAGLAHVRSLIEQGKKKQAGEELSRIDARFGGLAAPDSVELARTTVALPANPSEH
jgi:pimeloyl-ACP methyl ester carboxylesterase